MKAPFLRYQLAVALIEQTPNSKVKPYPLVEDSLLTAEGLGVPEIIFYNLKVTAVGSLLYSLTDSLAHSQIQPTHSLSHSKSYSYFTLNLPFFKVQICLSKTSRKSKQTKFLVTNLKSPISLMEKDALGRNKQ